MNKKTNDYYDKKIDNELKKKEIEKEFGAHFVKLNEDLPPEIESAWLNSVQEFEKQYENAKLTTVWEFMGKPSFKTKEELAPQELTMELKRLFELLQDSNIALDTLCEVDDLELYRFITEELFQYEMDDICMPGMTSCFTYEEFHPNAKLDIERAIDYFFRMTMGKMENFGGTGYDMLYVDTDKHENSAGNRVDKQIVIDSINNFLDAFDSFEVVSYEENDFELNQDETDAKVTFTIHYRGLFVKGKETYDFTGDGCFRLRPSEYGGWEMYFIDLPGLKIE